MAFFRSEEKETIDILLHMVCVKTVFVGRLLKLKKIKTVQNALTCVARSRFFGPFRKMKSSFFYDKTTLI